MNETILISICLLLVCFFSGMEVAFVSANKFKIELDKKNKSIISRLLTFFTQNQSKYITTILIGNTVSIIIYGIVMVNLLSPYLHNLLLNNNVLVFLTQVVASSLLLIFFAIFLPKIIFRINPNTTLNFFISLVFIFYIILYPLVFVINWLSRIILNLFFKINIIDEDHVYNTLEIDNYIIDSIPSEEDADDAENEIQLIHNALEFRNIKVRECMVPRTEIIAVEQSEQIEYLKETFSKTAVSKILIYKENIDNIIGYVNIKDIFKNPKTIKSILNNVLFFPESMNANKLLTAFLKKRKSIAVVVDEFGGTSGIVTIEDLIEEIFGEIEDEFDDDNYLEKQINNNEFVLSGRHEIDYLNDKYNLNIEETDIYETLAGFVLKHHESIPEKGDEIKIGKFLFKILEVKDAKIEKVLLKFLNQDDE